MAFSLVQVEKLQGEVGEKEKILKSLLGKFWIFVLLYVHVWVHERIILSVYGYGWLTKQVQNLLLHFSLYKSNIITYHLQCFNRANRRNEVFA